MPYNVREDLVLVPLLSEFCGFKSHEGSAVLNSIGTLCSDAGRPVSEHPQTPDEKHLRGIHVTLMPGKIVASAPL